MLTTLEEHLGYISDERRTALFRQALASAIAPGDLVADVGCGFGILGLLCLQSGAAHVWGIDRTDAIEIARETMTRAGLADRYGCIRDHSFRAVLPEPVDVVVCDHVGYFGFDYGIVATLGDARRRLLKPGGKVIPGRIKLMLAGVTSPDCRKKAEAWADAAIPPEFRWLREYGVNAKHAHSFAPGEIATAPAELGTIDLRSDTPDVLSFKTALAAQADTVLDGLAGWFDCELAGDVWMTNSPLAEGRIDRPQAFLAFDRPVEVRGGETIEVALTIRHEEGLIAWSVVDPRSRRKQKQSTWSSKILAGADLAGRSAKPAQLSPEGLARTIVLGYADGVRTGREIEQAVLRDHPQLLPSESEIRRFVQAELARSTG